MELYCLDDKVAFVSGAATGIGRAAAVAFAKSGAHVAIVDVNTDVGVQTEREIKESGGSCMFLKCDVSKDSEVKDCMNKIIKHYGRLDYAFNNAGIEGEQNSTAVCSEENWDRVIDINLKGVWLCMKYQIPQMVKQGGGSIVNCSSIAGLVGFAGIPAYVASKHGIVGLTKTAALELATSKVRVNAIWGFAGYLSTIERMKT